ncbi:hypothetical protein [uncultured Brevundimonas sp.]|nr:hypothetical protein [uncultured Brevundimonas sp.]
MATIGWLGGQPMNILYFLNRNVRAALFVAVGAVGLGAAGLIGWITAPI